MRHHHHVWEIELVCHLEHEEGWIGPAAVHHDHDDDHDPLTDECRDRTCPLRRYDDQ